MHGHWAVGYVGNLTRGPYICRGVMYGYSRSNGETNKTAGLYDTERCVQWQAGDNQGRVRSTCPMHATPVQTDRADDDRLPNNCKLEYHRLIYMAHEIYSLARSLSLA